MCEWMDTPGRGVDVWVDGYTRRRRRGYSGHWKAWVHTRAQRHTHTHTHTGTHTVTCVHTKSCFHTHKTPLVCSPHSSAYSSFHDDLTQTQMHSHATQTLRHMYTCAQCLRRMYTYTGLDITYRRLCAHSTMKLCVCVCMCVELCAGILGSHMSHTSRQHKVNRTRDPHPGRTVTHNNAFSTLIQHTLTCPHTCLWLWAGCSMREGSQHWSKAPVFLYTQWLTVGTACLVKKNALHLKYYSTRYCMGFHIVIMIIGCPLPALCETVADTHTTSVFLWVSKFLFSWVLPDASGGQIFTDSWSYWG